MKKMIQAVAMYYFVLMASSFTTAGDGDALYQAGMSLVIVALTTYALGRIMGDKKDDSTPME